MKYSLSLLTAALLAGVVSAGPNEVRGLGDPGTLQALKFETGKSPTLDLAGQDALRQLLVTGIYSSGQVRDLTRDVEYRVEPAGIVSIDSTGLVRPLRDGQAVIRATARGGISATLTAKVSHFAEDVPINFANEVVPIFTKFGCNAGGCHGKASGQNGFRLSLLGFEPGEDYEFIVKEARGRRLFPAAPERSLLLLKATGIMAHGGGKKLEPGSPFYNVLLRWVRQGAPQGKPSDPTVASIEVLPRERLLDRGGRQQLVVLAHLSDGTVRDVTRMTQFEANQPELAEVSDTGLVLVKQTPGKLAIMTRFQSQVDVFRGTVPLGAPMGKLPPASNFIDTLVFRQLQALGLPPSPLADDGTFLRRATIDIAGRLPTLKETQDFIADRDPKKYEKLIERLLASDDHADYFANKWSAVLRNRRASATETLAPTQAFHAWIREAMKNDRPYDQFVRDILTATGEEIKTPAVVWYRELREPASMMEDAAQLFLGQRLACARCHHHPQEKWSQTDYWGLAAFFSRVQVKMPSPPRKPKKKGDPPEPGNPALVSHRDGPAQMTHPRTNKPVRPMGLGGQVLPIDPRDDPRVKLAEWMTDPKNPFFARTLANRYWKHFMGRGLVDPEDDMRVTNPPSNPELLDALAKFLIDNKFSTRKLMQAICTSTVYRLSAVPNAYNADDRQNYSRFIPKRLHAEVLLDAIDDVTLSRTTFKGTTARRAVQLPDNMFESYFLSVFGRPDSASACECERSGDATLAQCLHMLNSQEILSKTSGPRAAQLSRDRRPPADRLRELYLIALSREPSKEELDTLTAYIEKKGKTAQSAYEDILWALINTKEFLFNH